MNCNAGTQVIAPTDTPTTEIRLIIFWGKLNNFALSVDHPFALMFRLCSTRSENSRRAFDGPSTRRCASAQAERGLDPPSCYSVWLAENVRARCGPEPDRSESGLGSVLDDTLTTIDCAA